MIVNNFPPASSPGSIRAAKFVKYLPQFEWQPIVLTVRNPSAELDDTLLKYIPEHSVVYRVQSLKPSSSRKQIEPKLSGRQTKRNNNPEQQSASKILLSLKRFVWDWIFIPDEGICWLPSAVYRGIQIARKHGINLLFSSSPNPSTHLIALLIKQVMKVPWIAEFRDPWTKYPLYIKKAHPIRQKIEEVLERKILKACDYVNTTTEETKNEFLREYYDLDLEINTVPNGFDPDDCDNLNLTCRTDKNFVMIHTGALSESRTPIYLFKALKALIHERPEITGDLKLLLIGNIRGDIASHIKEFGLEGIVKPLGHLSHSETLQSLAHSDILLLITAPGAEGQNQLPSKIFEYLAVRKPILALVPEGVSANLIRATAAGIVAHPQDVQAIKHAISDCYSKYKNNENITFSKLDMLEFYSVKQRTKNLTSIFSKVVLK